MWICSRTQKLREREKGKVRTSSQELDVIKFESKKKRAGCKKKITEVNRRAQNSVNWLVILSNRDRATEGSSWSKPGISSEGGNGKLKK